MQCKLKAVLAFIIVFATSYVYGQSFNPMIGGVSVYCNDVNGVSVSVQNIPGLPDTGISDFNGPIPRIKLNATFMSQLDSRMQLFTFAHECSHHMLGHVIQHLYGHSNQAREIEADCQAIRILKQQANITQADAAFIAQQFRNNPPMPPYYPAGPWREANILSCYGNSTEGDSSSSVSSSEVQACMDRRPAACIETCQDKFNLPPAQCSIACQPNDPKNRSPWLAECKKNPDW